MPLSKKPIPELKSTTEGRLRLFARYVCGFVAVEAALGLVPILLSS